MDDMDVTPAGDAAAEAVANETTAAPEQEAPEQEAIDLTPPPPTEEEIARLRATIEAIVYITDEPLTAQQMAAALEVPVDRIKQMLDDLVEEYARPERGLSIREVAGGYKMATKAEHHEQVRAFVKKLTPPLKLSLAALETLAVIAYKQPVTAPEIMEVRGVQGAGVLKTLLDRKLITESGRKNVVGKPILYKTTKDFLVQFGLKDVGELPTLKEFEELGRLELIEESPSTPEAEPTAETEAPPEPQTGSAEESTTAGDTTQTELKPEPEPEPESNA